MDYYKRALEIKPKLVEWRRDFHMHPELGFDVNRTSLKIREFLESLDIEYYVTAKTGICAIIRGNGNKTIGLRADMDALPITEKNNCDYVSLNQGVMHACGHDAHSAILMGAAYLLNEKRANLKGNVKLFFEPAEETTGGAKVMISEGVLSKPEVDVIFGLHVEENLNSGCIGIKRGVVNAASNPFTIKIKGVGGHGAHPDSTVDPIVAAAHIITICQTLVSRELPPTSPAVVTFGCINGGTAQNIIPEEVVLSGIIRTMTKEERKYTVDRFKGIVLNTAKTFRATAEVNIEESYPCLYNDDAIADRLEASAAKVLPKENIIKLQNPSMGVESFAYFSMNKPSAFYYLGCRNEAKGIVHPTHGSYFDIDEDCLVIGAALQSQAASDYLLLG